MWSLYCLVDFVQYPQALSYLAWPNRQCLSQMARANNYFPVLLMLLFDDEQHNGVDNHENNNNNNNDGLDQDREGVIGIRIQGLGDHSNNISKLWTFPTKPVGSCRSIDHIDHHSIPVVYS
jgi:hypothetical protein